VRIDRDRKLWEIMVLRLSMFYHMCLLTEIADGRISRGMKVREPAYILDEIVKQNNKKK
jgi:hypothetical protein